MSSYNKCNSSIIKENKEVGNELCTIEFRRKVFYRERGEIKDVAEQDRCHIAIDCKICYLKSSSLSEDILALLRTKKQGTKGEE